MEALPCMINNQINLSSLLTAILALCSDTGRHGVCYFDSEYRVDWIFVYRWYNTKLSCKECLKSY